MIDTKVVQEKLPNHRVLSTPTIVRVTTILYSVYALLSVVLLPLVLRTRKGTVSMNANR